MIRVMSLNRPFTTHHILTSGEGRPRAARLPDQGAAAGAGQGQQPHGAPPLPERRPRTHATG